MTARLFRPLSHFLPSPLTKMVAVAWNTPLHPSWPQSLKQLPIEILDEIFSHHSPPTLHSGLRTNTIVTLPPLSFTTVCRTWKHTVASNPRLWASFVILFEDTSSGRPVSPYHHERLLANISLWLARSRSAPLSVSLVSENLLSGIMVHPVLADITRMLGYEKKRWKEMQFRVPQEALTLLRELPPIDSTTTSLLFVANTLDDEESWVLPRTGDVAPPTLKSLHLEPGLHLPDLNGVTRMLDENSGALRHVTIIRVRDSFRWNLSRSIEGPSLISLKLALCDPIWDSQSFETFLRFLSAPKLLTLDVDYRYNRISPVDLAHLSVAFISIGRTLTTLIAVSWPVSSTEFLDVIGSLHLLQRMFVQLAEPLDITDVFLERLTLRQTNSSNDEGLCPQLEQVTIEGKRSYSIQAVVDMVKSRVDRTGRRFRRFEILPWTEDVHVAGMIYHPQVWDHFREWREMGIVIRH
ncbi:hypothetical protein DL96DRAFT_1593449 [Flagelloscypha sp. PMI_526]|nr:hypothetical protein DL96DRAFT_1593449 [Flagelloscypha sp. PMI_526]